METMMMVISGKHPQICFEKKKKENKEEKVIGVY